MKDVDNYLLNLRMIPASVYVNKKVYQILFNSLKDDEKKLCKYGIPYHGTILCSYEDK